MSEHYEFTTQDMLHTFTTHVQGGSEADFFIWLTAHEEQIRQEERENITAPLQHPAPVQHPNPDEHELIFVFALKTHDYMVSDGRQLMIWDGEHYVNSENMVRPESITEWSPAEADTKVVEDDR